MSKEETPMVILHLKEGEQFYFDGNMLASKGVRVLIIDENAPNDRVYEISLDDLTEDKKVSLIRDGEPIGNKNDDRHEAVENRILSSIDGRPRFTVIDGDRSARDC